MKASMKTVPPLLKKKKERNQPWT